MYIIDSAAYNSFVLFAYGTEIKSRDRRKTIETLAKELINDCILIRINTMYCANYKYIQDSIIKNMIEIGFVINKNKIVYENDEKPGGKKCFLCDSTNPTKYRKFCDKCQEFICNQHSSKITVCVNCKN